MKKSVRVLAGILGIFLLGGCTSKTDKKQSETKALETSETSDTVKSESEDPSSFSSEGSAQETTKKNTDPASAAKSAFEAFLKGSTGAETSFLIEHSDDFALVDFSKDLKEEVKLSELTAFMNTHARMHDRSDITVSFCYPDFGSDGVPELLLRVGGFGYSDAQIVVRYADDKLQIKGFYESWERSSTEINSAGAYVCGGAGGAAMHISVFGYLDEQSELHNTLELTEYAAQYEQMDPQFQAFDSYYGENGTPDLVLIRVEVMGDEPFYTYTFNSDNVDEQRYTQGDIFELMEGTKLPYVPFPEAKEKIEKCKGDIFRAPPVEWVKLK